MALWPPSSVIFNRSLTIRVNLEFCAVGLVPRALLRKPESSEFLWGFYMPPSSPENVWKLGLEGTRFHEFWDGFVPPNFHSYSFNMKWLLICIKMCPNNQKYTGKSRFIKSVVNLWFPRHYSKKKVFRFI